jgi:hypothetical protein
MSEDETWYRCINDNNDLMQGDLIYGCPYVVPPKDISVGTDIKVDIIEYNIMILTQSCDLEKNNLDHVLVCPFWTLNEIEDIYPQLKDNNLKESTKRGYQPAWLLLDKHDDDFLIVDFRYAYSVPMETLNLLINMNPIRWRLISPYREHLSQEFAKFFMRVGLPKGIPHFSKFKIDYCRKCPVQHTVRE